MATSALPVGGAASIERCIDSDLLPPWTATKIAAPAAAASPIPASAIVRVRLLAAASALAARGAPIGVTAVETLDAAAATGVSVFASDLAFLAALSFAMISLRDGRLASSGSETMRAGSGSAIALRQLADDDASASSSIGGTVEMRAESRCFVDCARLRMSCKPESSCFGGTPADS